MFATLFPLLGAATLILGQTTTQTLYIPGADVQPLVASVIGADATATTYLLQCSPGTDSSDCGFDGPVTLTEGPATAAYTFPAENFDNGTLAFTGYQDCALYGTTSAVCVESAGGAEANFPGMSTVTYTGTDQPYMPVVVTGAVAQSTPAPASVTTTSSGVRSTPAATAVSTATGGGASSPGAATKTSSSGPGATAGTSTSASSAGGAVVTLGAKLVVGGGAAALLGLLL